MEGDIVPMLFFGNKKQRLKESQKRDSYKALLNELIQRGKPDYNNDPDSLDFKRKLREARRRH